MRAESAWIDPNSSTFLFLDGPTTGCHQLPLGQAARYGVKLLECLQSQVAHDMVDGLSAGAADVLLVPHNLRITTCLPQVSQQLPVAVYQLSPAEVNSVTSTEIKLGGC